MPADVDDGQGVAQILHDVQHAPVRGECDARRIPLPAPARLAQRNAIDQFDLTRPPRELVDHVTKAA
jgi:hypothetical protein